MSGDHIQLRIDRLLERAEEALDESDWQRVRELTENILASDPDNADARDFQAAAERAMSIDDNEGYRPDRQTIGAGGAKGQSIEEEPRRLAEENAAMAEIGRIISSSLDINEVYQVFANQVLTLIPFSRLEITVIDQEHEQDEVAFSTTLTTSANEFGGIFSLEGSLTGNLASSRTGLIVQGMTADEVETKYPCLESSVKAEYCSWLAVPLINRDGAIGALFLTSSTAMAFKEQDLYLAERIGYQIAGAVANAKLYSERLRMEEHIRDVNLLASIGELAAGVAHEINNPLTSILGFSQLLLSQDLPPQIKEDLQTIHSEAQRAAKIVRHLQLFSRRSGPDLTFTNLNSSLERALELKSYDFKVSNIEVSRYLQADLLWTMSDEHQMVQVFVNLLTNAQHAIESSNRKGRIIVYSSESEGKLKISIHNNGPGIPPDHLGRIFEPFFTTKDVGSGTGLGLSICHGIVQGHGGRVWAESGGPVGATFHIELPIVPSEQPEDSQAQPSGLILSATSHVLVVDDEPSLRELLRRYLEFDRYTVDLAEDGQEALRKLQTMQYDCIVLDLKMPGMSGQELYRRIQDFNPLLASKVVFITGDTVTPRTRAFISSTGSPLIHKPFEAEELGSHIRNLVQTTHMGS